MRRARTFYFKYQFIHRASFIPLLAALLLSGCTERSASRRAAERQREVIAYTYDSFAGDWGPGPTISHQFQEASGYRLTLIDCGDAVQAYNRALLERDSPVADLVIGIDNTLASQARAAGILAPYVPERANDIIAADLRAELGDDGLLTPYDYGYFAFVYDTQSATPPPTSLEDMTGEAYRKKIILMDPRTATPGLGLLAWTVAVYGDGYAAYWERLLPNVLTMTSGWSEGWGMFQGGEAPLVISYTTSPAYSAEYEQSDRYRALEFAHGHVRQVEGYGLLAGAPNPDGAKALMDYLITEEAQAVLPLTQWMYPVNTTVSLPESFRTSAPVPALTIAADTEATARARDGLSRLLAQ